jgi:peroxiredoxin Q/BCP
MPIAGETAPDFELQNDEGKPVKLSDYRGKKVVLYFYPEDFTSGCEMQACMFRDAYPQIEEKNAVVLGVSPDSVERHKEFREALDLPFNLLADPDFKVSRAYASQVDKTLDDGTTIPRVQRGHYVIDEQGKIVDVQAPVRAAESTKLALEKL